MKVIRNKQGSALIWVLVICLIFGILGVAIGWVALSMNRRSIKNDNLNQSYFTALSVADSVVNGLNGYEDGNKESKAFYDDLYKNLVYGNRVSNQDYFMKYEDVLNTNDATEQEKVAGMGKCNVEAAMSMGKAKITSTATVNDTTETVIVEAYRKTESTDWPAKEWATELKNNDWYASNGNSNPNNRKLYVGNNDSIKNDETKKNVSNGSMDVAVYKLKAGEKLSGKLTISRDTTSLSGDANENLEKKAVFIYLEEGAHLTLYGMDYELFAGTTSKKVTVNTKDKWFEKETGDTTEYTTESWENYYGPDIFIYMESGSKLTFYNPNRNTQNGEVVPFPLYIVGPDATETSESPKVEAGNGVGNAAVKIYWMKNIDIALKNNSTAWLHDSDDKAFSEDADKNKPSRKPLSGYSQTGRPHTGRPHTDNAEAGNKLEGTAGILQNHWTINKYERKQVQQ